MVRALSIVAFLAGASAVSALRPVAGISPVMIFKRDSGALEARQQLEPCGGDLPKDCGVEGVCFAEGTECCSPTVGCPPGSYCVDLCCCPDGQTCTGSCEIPTPTVVTNTGEATIVTTSNVVVPTTVVSSTTSEATVTVTSDTTNTNIVVPVPTTSFLDTTETGGPTETDTATVTDTDTADTTTTTTADETTGETTTATTTTETPSVTVPPDSGAGKAGQGALGLAFLAGLFLI